MFTNKVLKPLDIANDYDLFLVDIWGVIFDGKSTYPEVVEQLNWMSKQKTLCFVTNSPRLKEGVQNILTGFGIEVETHMIYSSGEVASMMITESEKYLGITKPVIYEVTDNHFKNLYSSTNWNFTQNISDANILLVTAQIQEGEDLTKYDAILEEAAKLGLVCICPNPDTIIPNGDAKTYCPGFIVRNYQGKLIYTGKPHSYIYAPILEKYSHIQKDRILMIGDTLDMDILGAHNVGIKSALVNTGNSKLLREKLGISDFVSIREHIELQPSILLSLTS